MCAGNESSGSAAATFLTSGPVGATIRQFLTLSEDAENHNDMKSADALAERAWILAQELKSGK